MAREVVFIVIRIQLDPKCEQVPNVSFYSEKSCRDQQRFIGVPKLPQCENQDNVDKERQGNRVFSDIFIETYSKCEASSTKVISSVNLEGSSETLTTDGSSTLASSVKKPYYSGNPNVELTRGVLHIFREDKKTATNSLDRSLMLCIMAVPAHRAFCDLMELMSPFLAHSEHIWVFRDLGRPNAYMVFLRFHSQQATNEFYEVFNGKPYNSSEGDVCHMNYVSKIEVFKSLKNSGWFAGVPLTGHTELPTCTVCLERMDETVSGVLTILCNHSLQPTCFAGRHSDNGTCPVCRYSQNSQTEKPSHSCHVCGASDNLWVCLLCGHVGCGRYKGGHAYTHYMLTEHTFAMELESNSVWDYAGDNYVHRLFQNKNGGKLVRLKQQESEAVDEKMDSVQLEYSYLLTSQLEKQRHHFEECLENRAKETARQITELKDKTRIAVEERKQLEEKMVQVTKERDMVRRKLETITAQCAATRKELIEERQLNRCLLTDQKSWQAKLSAFQAMLDHRKKEAKKKIADLEEQVRDMTFFWAAKSKIDKQGEDLRKELAAGSIVIGPGNGCAGSRISTDATGQTSASRPRKINRKNKKKS